MPGSTSTPNMLALKWAKVVMCRRNEDGTFRILVTGDRDFSCDVSRQQAVGILKTARNYGARTRVIRT